MISLLASARAGGGLDRVDHAVQLLEDAWRKQGDVPLERLWVEQRRLIETDSGGSIVMLTELIRTDLRCRFARGQTPTVAAYLARFPQLQSADSRVLSLIYEEFCLAEERGDRIDVDSFCDRYPRWKDSLVSQLQYHHLLSKAAGLQPKGPPFPDAGDSFEEFRLVSLLGRGGTSRVFLARDLSLGGKRVVLKVSLDRGREPQAQGALDHPHIVPVNSVVFSDDGMRGLSMPCRSGLPLDEVIRRVEPAARPRHALALWEALVRPTSPPADPRSEPDAPPKPEGHAPGPRGDGWEGFPVRGSYAQGVGWVVKIVAEALHYAHGEQTFHRDVKPANVLLTHQHGPQLLDFNLAESPHSASQAQAAMHGGTLPYMAPEQIEAFLDQTLWGKVGAQADVYSLGLVLRELLTGQAPDLPAETLAPARAMRVLLDRRPLLDVSVRRVNPAIPHALEAVVAKCLAVPTDERYPDAGALAEDLRRFLEHLPLVHAVNPSPRERSANWASRNRLRLVVAAACLFPLAAVPVGMAIERSRSGRPLGPIQTASIFTAAVADFEKGEAQGSIGPLKDVCRLYPGSALPRLYLVLALNACRHTMEADGWFDELLRIAEGDEELVAWGARHPLLAQQMNLYLREKLQTATDLRLSRGLSERERMRQQSQQLRLAGRASQILDGIHKELEKHRVATALLAPAKESADLRSNSPPDSDPSEYNQALTEQELEHYESVIKRADRALEALRSQQPVGAIEEFQLAESLYKWRRLRSRALTKLAERLRKDGSQAARQEALKHLAAAFEDLTQCGRFAAGRDGLLETHSVQRIRAEALMTRVDLDIDLGLLAFAKQHLKHARTGLKRYDDIARVVDRRYELEGFYERMNEIDARLRREEAKISRPGDGERARQ